MRILIYKLHDVSQYNNLSMDIRKSLEYIKKLDLLSMKEGIYEIDEEENFLVVSEYDTKCS